MGRGDVRRDEYRAPSGAQQAAPQRGRGTTRGRLAARVAPGYLGRMDGDFAPGTLSDLLAARTRAALRSGALQPMGTQRTHLVERGIRFTIRVLDPQLHATLAAIRRDPGFNPFLPYDPDLFVADISDTHVGLLNKFPVVDHHLLVVTRHFEAQESGLTAQDFEALARCMADVDGLAFYNSGLESGASQRHKHLQLVPLPFGPLDGPGPAVPIEAAFAPGAAHPPPRAPELPFVHALARLAQADGRALDAAFRRLWQELDLAPGQPHNLLLTRRWMLLVPRSAEAFEGMPVNAMGFAGSMLVRHAEALERVRQVGPLQVLRQVGVPSPA